MRLEEAVNIRETAHFSRRSQSRPAMNPLRRATLGATLAAVLPSRAGAAAVVAPVAASGRVWRIAAAGSAAALTHALSEAADGDTLELGPGVHRGAVGVVRQARLTIRGAGGGEPCVLDADGHDAEGKAILVAMGQELNLESLVLRGCRVPDGNGAGVRHESGVLRARACTFVDNENGILAGNAAGLVLLLERCRFGPPAASPAGLKHLLYAGRIDRLEVHQCSFGPGNSGHLLKSRARISAIVGNVLADAWSGQAAGRAAYELEFAEGGEHQVSGNLLVQSPASLNPALLSFGAEGWRLPAGSPPARLELSDNLFVNLGSESASFVRFWSQRLPKGSGWRATNNRFAGPGRLALPSAANAGGNRRIVLAELQGFEQLSWRLPPSLLAPGRS
jgi:hypothetical protein